MVVVVVVSVHSLFTSFTWSVTYLLSQLVSPSVNQSINLWCFWRFCPMKRRDRCMDGNFRSIVPLCYSSTVCQRMRSRSTDSDQSRSRSWLVRISARQGRKVGILKLGRNCWLIDWLIDWLYDRMNEWILWSVRKPVLIRCVCRIDDFFFWCHHTHGNGGRFSSWSSVLGEEW